MEDRTLLSAITVRNTLDDGSVGSLRWAVEQANAGGGAETINFDPALFNTPQTITLTQGQLELSDPTGTETITGPAAGLTVSGGGHEPGFPGGQGRHGVDLGTDHHRRQRRRPRRRRPGQLRHDHADRLHRQRQLRRYGGGLTTAATATLARLTLTELHRQRQLQRSARGGGLSDLRRHAHADQLHRQRQPASDNGGGLFHNSHGTTTLTNCTVSGNSAGSGGGLDRTQLRPR